MSLKKGQFGFEVPPQAKRLERIAGGVGLYDASPLIPRGKGYPGKARSGVPIDRIFVHHSGARGKGGFAGAWHSAAFVTRPKWKGGRGFPSAAYHLWISRERLIGPAMDFAVLLLNPFEVRAWHTGAHANDRGIGVCLQGDTSKDPITVFQEECLEAVIPWLAEKFDMRLPAALSWHSEGSRHGGRSKAACPGRSAEGWLRGYRRGITQPRP